MSLLQLLAQWGGPRPPQPTPVHVTAPIIHCASCARELASCVYCGQVHETQITPICPACTQIAQVGMLLCKPDDPSKERRPYAFD